VTVAGPQAPGIRKVGLLGAGAHDAGIAAHVANAGVPVVLLDIVPPASDLGEDAAWRS